MSSFADIRSDVYRNLLVLSIFGAALAMSSFTVQAEDDRAAQCDAVCSHAPKSVRDQCVQNCMKPRTRSAEERRAEREKKLAERQSDREQQKLAREEKRRQRTEQKAALENEPLRRATLTVAWNIEKQDTKSTITELLDATAELELPDFPKYGLPRSGFVYRFNQQDQGQSRARLLSLSGKATARTRENDSVPQNTLENKFCDVVVELEGSTQLTKPDHGNVTAVRLLGDGVTASVEMVKVNTSGHVRSQCKWAEHKKESTHMMLISSITAPNPFNLLDEHWTAKHSRNGDTWETDAHMDTVENGNRKKGKMHATLTFH